MATYRDSAGRVTRSTCAGGHRHWFAYPGQVGTSSPVCTRYACDGVNPNYEPTRDPNAVQHPMTCWCDGTGLRENGARCNMTEES